MAPRVTVPVEADRASTADSVGPVQGAQPSPNITPSSGAPARPALGRVDGRTILPANENRSKAPANRNPSTMVRPPRTWVSSRAWPVSRWPSPPRAAPRATNTIENPSTNSAVPATTRPREPREPREPRGARGARGRRGPGNGPSRHRHSRPVPYSRIVAGPVRRCRLSLGKACRGLGAGAAGGAGHAGDEGEIAGHQRQDARGQERDRAGRGSDRQGQDQRTGGHELAHAAHDDPGAIKPDPARSVMRSLCHASAGGSTRPYYIR